jgi:transcription elongation factor Elf1
VSDRELHSNDLNDEMSVPPRGHLNPQTVPNVSWPRTGVCLHCGRPLGDKRKRYHPACLPLAQEAARKLYRNCRRCKKLKAPSSFSDDKGRPTGKFPWCKDCQTKYATDAERVFQPADGELNGHICPMDDVPIRGHANRRFCSAPCKDRARSLRAKYDLSPEQYRRMVDATGGRCPICQNRVRTWNVDHDHKTRKVTGVVCGPCNVGPLMTSNHDLDRVSRLLMYLSVTPASTLGVNVLVPEDQNRPSQLHRTWERRSTRSVTGPRP